jgi:transposase
MLSDNIKFRDIVPYDAPLCGASVLANGHAEKCQMEQRVIARLLTLKGLKATEIEMELTSVYIDEALQISAVNKWRRHFLQGRTELGDKPRSGRPANSDLRQVIAELI